MNDHRLRSVFVVLVLVGACTSTTTDTTTVSPTTTTLLSDQPVETGDAQQATISEQLDWFLGLLNGDDLDAGTYETRFVPEFIDQVPYDSFIELTDQIASQGTGWTLLETETQGSDNAIVLVSPVAGEPVLRVLMNIDSNGVIDGLFVQPGEPPSLDDPPQSYGAAFDRLEALGTAGVIVAETTNGSCDPIAAVNADTALPIGSMFKLYVLGALVDQVASGTVEWDDLVVLDERLYSHPSGITQNADPGSTVTVYDLAERMISISDNTATDHLIALVGREVVEEVQAEMGHSNPDLNLPFLTTRELFQLKLGDVSLLSEYVDADRSGRALLLDRLADGPLPPIGVDSFADPILPLDAEWFATPTDLCAAWTSLSERASVPASEELAAIVSNNPGIPDTNGTWDEIWFKGGSEPGVLGLSWHLAAGDRSFVVAGMVANAENAFDQTEAALLLGAVRDLLAAEISG